MQSDRSKTLALILVVAPLLVLWRPIFFGETFYYQDLGAQYFPTEQMLMRGVSGWNPHIFLGLPLLGDPQTAPYEPIRALGRAAHLPVTFAFDLYVAFYLLVASLGAYAFALRRRAAPVGALLAGLAFVWGGVVMLRIRHPWYLVGLAMTPWVALACDRLLERRRLVDAIVVAFLIAWAALGGHPQAPFMLWLFVAAYVALFEPLRGWLAIGWRLGVAAILFGGMIAVYYAPVVAQAMHAERHGAGLAFAGSYSWNPWDWVRLVSPDIYGNDMARTHFGTRNYHEQTIYLGIAPLVLAMLAVAWKLERPLARLSAGAFVLAAGRFLPLFYVFYYVVPGFKQFRAPVRYGAFFALATATLAALALTQIARDQKPPSPERTARRVAWSCGIVALVFAVGFFVAGAWIDAYTEPGAHTTMRWAAARTTVLMIAVALVLHRWLRGRLAGARAATLLCVLTGLDLALQWAPYRQTADPAVAFVPPNVARPLVAVKPARILVDDYRKDGEPNVTPLLNGGEAAGYDNLRGYNQLVGADVLAVFRKADQFGGSRDEYYALGPVDPAEWLLDLTGVVRIVSPTGILDRKKGALPRAWIVGAAEVHPSAAALDRLPTLDAQHVAIVETDVGLPTHSRAWGDARLVQLTADDVTIEAEASSPALLVLADHFDTGWTATVDGKAQPIVRTDYLFRGVRIDAGVHRVVFHYQPPGRRLGGYITFAALLIAIGIVCSSLLRRRRPASPEAAPAA